MKVAYTAEALGDVASILSFVAKRSPSHAPDIAARVDMAVKALKVFPRAARFDGETDSYEQKLNIARAFSGMARRCRERHSGSLRPHVPRQRAALHQRHLCQRGTAEGVALGADGGSRRSLR